MSDSANRIDVPDAAAARALLQQAMDAHRAGDIDAAETGYREILDRFPHHADALHLLGTCRHQRRAGREAYELVSEAIAANPDAPEYHNTLGMILMAAGKHDLAVQCFTRALRLRPDYRDAQNNLALALSEMRRYAEAETVLRHAIAERPDDPVLLTGLGRLRLFMQDIAGALACFHDALKVAPEHVGALNNIGVALNLLGDRDGAGAAFERALALDSAHVDAHFNYAQLLLLQGRYAEAWPHFEWRLQRRDYRRRFDAPPWRGEPLDGRTILIWCEQGFGDAIQFIRYAPMVAARGGRVVVECRPPLRRLFAGVPGVSAVSDIGKATDYAVQVPIMSLPGIFGTTVETIPGDIPYVPVPRTSAIDGGGKRLKVGLVWAGNPDNARDRARSRKLGEFGPFAARDDVAFFSLQVGAGADDKPPPGLEIRNLMPEVKDFHDTAADMAGLDLIVSVDSSSAHLAGAIGVPVWVLLDAVADWRWLTDRGDTPWYPTMRLFRRTGTWDALIAEVAAAMKSFAPRSR
jgi:tetratricopeptide (TPR) repeat protein